MAAAKKTASTAAKSKTPRPANTAKWIRNLRNHPVHLRFKQEGSDRPWFTELAPRGRQGDAEKIPAKLTQTRQFSEAVYGQLVEVITEKEANEVEYEAIGYLAQSDTKVTLVRDEDTVVRRSQSLDASIQQNPRSTRMTAAAPTVVQMPGSAPVLQPRADGVAPTAEDMVPAGVDLKSRKVTLERHRA